MSKLGQPMAHRQVVGWQLGLAVYATLIFVASVIPIVTTPSVGRLDKAAHLGAYLLFAWLLVRTMRVSGWSLRPLGCWAWAVASSYGALLELVQMALPWRSAEWGDVLANMVGAAMGALVSRAW